MSHHTEEALKAMEKVPKIAEIKEAIDGLVGVVIPYPIILEIQHEVETLRLKLVKLGY